jgi:glycosyltransferase involved in cell wall biosynthesis
MRIWMVCETLAEGCAPNVTVLEIRNSLRKQGHEVLLFCPAIERKQVRPGESGVYFVPTVLPPYLNHVFYQLSLPVVMGLSRLREKPDWIYTRPHFATIAPAVVGWLLRIPHILHLSGDPVDQLMSAKQFSLLRVPYTMLEKVNCKLSRGVVVETPNMKDIYEKRHGLRPEKVFAIANGVNTELFRPMDKEEARREMGIERDVPIVGYQGNIREHEGIDHLVEAAASVLQQVPMTRFLIVGDGPAKEHLMEIARSTGVLERFSFVGRVQYESVPAYIACMDVCVVPRNRDRFQKTGISSLKVREYLACGRSVVGTDITGIGDLLREADAGIALSPENPGELAEAVIKLLQDKSLREKMGSRGREFAVQHLSWDATARAIVGAYRAPRKWGTPSRER